MRLEGRISVKAAMLAGNRTVSRIYVRDDLNDRDTSFILHRAEERGILIERLSETQINEMAQGKTHGGILADTGERTFQELSACLENDCPFVVMLEGVEDPFNLGYVIRSLYSAGCTGLILRNRDWSWSENTIVRSSAGAYEYMNVYHFVMDNDENVSVTWVVDGAECSLSTGLEKEDVYEIIKSIYRR